MSRTPSRGALRGALPLLAAALCAPAAAQVASFPPGGLIVADAEGDGEVVTLDARLSPDLDLADRVNWYVLPAAGAPQWIGQGAVLEHRFAAQGAYAVRMELQSPGGSSATDLVVDLRPPRRVPADFPTIADALAGAVNGDTILIAPGTYSGPGNVGVDVNPSVHIRGEGNDPAAVVIDCENGGRAFNIVNPILGDDRTRISGLTLRNGYPGPGEDGGAIQVLNRMVRIDGCVFEGNRAVRGGAIFTEESRAWIGNCVLRGNRASATGSAVHANSPAFQVDVGSCTIVGHDGSGATVSGPIAVHSSILWDNGPVPMAVADISDSVVQGGWAGPGANNSTADPAFRDLAGGDLRLLPTSPAIDLSGNDLARFPSAADLNRLGSYDAPGGAGLGALPNTDAGALEHVPYSAMDVRVGEAIVTSLSEQVQLGAWLEYGGQRLPGREPTLWVAESGSVTPAGLYTAPSTQLSLLGVRAVFSDPFDGMAIGEAEVVPHFLRGDVNLDGKLELADATYLLTSLFVFFPPNPPLVRPLEDAADVNDDGAVNLPDAVNLLAHLFSGKPLPPPTDVAGPDLTPDDLP